MADMPLPGAPANNEAVSPDAPANADANQLFRNNVIVRNMVEVADAPKDLLALSQINSCTRSETFHMLRKLHEVQFETIERGTETELQFSDFTATGTGAINSSLRIFAENAINLRSLDFSKCLRRVDLTPLQELQLKNVTKFTVNPNMDPYLNEHFDTFERMITNSLSTLKELYNPPYNFLSYVDKSREGSYDLDVLTVDIAILKPAWHYPIIGCYVHDLDQRFIEALEMMKTKKLVLFGHNRVYMFERFHTQFIKLAAVQDLSLLTGTYTSLSHDFQYIEKWAAGNVIFPDVVRFELHFLEPAFVKDSAEHDYTTFINRVSAIFPNLQLFELHITNKVPRDKVSLLCDRVRNYWRSNYMFGHRLFVTYPKSEDPNDTTLNNYLGTIVLQSNPTIEITYTCV